MFPLAFFFRLPIIRYVVIIIITRSAPWTVTAPDYFFVCIFMPALLAWLKVNVK